MPHIQYTFDNGEQKRLEITPELLAQNPELKTVIERTIQAAGDAAESYGESYDRSPGHDKEHDKGGGHSKEFSRSFD